MGHPSKFQRGSRLAFFTAATSLTGGQPNFARSLAVSWAATLYIHFRRLLSLTELCRCKIHFTSKSCVLLYCQRYCTVLQQRASAKPCGMVQGMELRSFRRGRQLYSAGRPSRWASAHILGVKLRSPAALLCYNVLEVYAKCTRMELFISVVQKIVVLLVTCCRVYQDGYYRIKQQELIRR